jgi:hypothetical protein
VKPFRALTHDEQWSIAVIEPGHGVPTHSSSPSPAGVTRKPATSPHPQDSMPLLKPIASSDVVELIEHHV